MWVGRIEKGGGYGMRETRRKLGAALEAPVWALEDEGNLVLCPRNALSPLAAWRRYRGLSQAALARKAGLSQVWVGRIEKGGGYGTRETRRKLAAALEAPVWALENEGGKLVHCPEFGRCD